MNMIDDVFDNADCYNDYDFNDLLSELQRTGEILRQFEAGEMPPGDDNISPADDE